MSFTESYAIDEVVSTIYVNGFPEDFKEREFQNLFAFAKGFDGCSLRIPSLESEPSGSPLLRCFSSAPRGQILGFAKFRTFQDAVEACRILNGRLVDTERGSTLKAELAKKNLVLGPGRGKSTLGCYTDMMFGPNLTRRASVPTTAVYQPSPKCSNSCNSCEQTYQAGGGSRLLNLSIPGQANPVPVAAPNTLGRDQPFVVTDISTRSSSSITNCAIKLNSTSTSLSSAALVPSLVTSGGLAFFAENPPCNTLYVGNLPPNANEIELRSIFVGVNGFRRMSFKPKIGGSPMCFVEFDDIRAATMAMESLYGTMLSNSTKGGIRLSYSKNPLGVRSGPPVSSYLGSSLYADLFSPLPELAARDFLPADMSNLVRFMESPITPGTQ